MFRWSVLLLKGGVLVVMVDAVCGLLFAECGLRVAGRWRVTRGPRSLAGNDGARLFTPFPDWAWLPRSRRCTATERVAPLPQLIWNKPQPHQHASMKIN